MCRSGGSATFQCFHSLQPLLVRKVPLLANYIIIVLEAHKSNANVLRLLFLWQSSWRHKTPSSSYQRVSQSSDELWLMDLLFEKYLWVVASRRVLELDLIILRGRWAFNQVPNILNKGIWVEIIIFAGYWLYMSRYTGSANLNDDVWCGSIYWEIYVISMCFVGGGYKLQILRYK